MPKLSLQDYERFLAELGAFSRAGLATSDGLRRLAASDSQRALKNLAAATADEIEKGRSLSDAMEALSPKPPEQVIAMVRCAEESGRGLDLLRFASVHLRHVRRLRATLLTAVSYPLLLVSASLIVVMAASHSLGATLGELFDRVGMPESDRGSFYLIEMAASSIGAAVLLGGAALTGALLALPWLRQRLVDVLMCLPLAHGVARNAELGVAMRFLSQMLSEGVPPDVAYRAASLFLSRPRALAFGEMAKAASEGRNAAQHLPQGIPAMAGYLFEVGERAGTLATSCDAAADYCDEIQQRQGPNVGKLLEPVLLLVPAALVILMVVSLYLPLFNIGDALQ